MSFDPEMFGRAMGEAIRKSVEPLQAQIAELKSQIASLPSPINGRDGVDGAPGRDGKDCDMAALKAMIDEAVKAIPVVHGKDGLDGKDGSPGAPGERGEKGEDGAGVADLLIDRDGSLVATYTDGRMKSLGKVVGTDGRDGVDGKDGIGLESFDLDYLRESHEISIRAACAGRVKELRYPAGGIRPAGYWRDGSTAKAGEAWVHDGSLWIATKDSDVKPDTNSGNWIIAARKGRDGERGARGKDGAPPAPIPVKA